MPNPTFKQLNVGWSAEPNAPQPEVVVNACSVSLWFFFNSQLHAASVDEKGCITFLNCSIWRLGSTNDEGWYNGQCRYSKLAPIWGEFYELSGEDDQQLMPMDWHELAPPALEQRHFLFYFRDETFECFAADWSFETG